MSNTILTPSAVTREALRVLHQKLNFVGSISREYDDSYAKTGAKIGNTLNIRLPNQYVVRSGAILSTQDTTETSIPLVVSTQKGVDLNFTSVDLTMSLDDFSRRVLDPAMAVLAANIEADAMNMVKDVYNQVSNTGSAITFNKVLQARKALVDNLAPPGDRTCSLNTQDNVDLVDALKGLFQDSTNIAKQYREGFMGRTAGFDFMENTLWPAMAPGSRSGYLINGASQTGATLTVDTGTGTITQGEVFTIAGVYRVHPESKVSTGVLQQFVATAAQSGGTTSIAISPAIVTSGAAQNVSNAPADNAALVDSGGLVYDHETGFNYGGQMPYAEAGQLSLGAGDSVMHVKQLYPDDITIGDVTASFAVKNNRDDPYVTFGPYALAAQTDLRFVGRQVKTRFTGAGLSDWRVGTPALEIEPGGER